jgi:hypothetical protein
MHMLQYAWAPLSAWAGGKTVGGCASRGSSKVGTDGDRVGALAGAVDPEEEAANDVIKREAASIEMPMRLPIIIVNNYTIIIGTSLKTKFYLKPYYKNSRSEEIKLSSARWLPLTVGT